MGRKIQQLLLFCVYLLVLGAGNVWASSYYITIDALNTVQIEEGGEGTFTVSLDQLPLYGDEVYVQFAVTDGTATLVDVDYSPTTGILIFNAANSQSQTFTVDTSSDSKFEPEETIAVLYTATKSDGTNGVVNLNWFSNSTNGTIVNNDYKVIAFNDQSVTENVGNAELTVQLDRTVVGNDVEFTVSHTPGSADATDYTAPSSVLTIIAGDSSGIISVPIIDDALVEPDETFVVTITPSSGNVTVADSNAEVTIVNDDYSVSAFADLTVAEDIGNAELTVQLDRAVVGDDVKFTVSHTPGTALTADYTASSSVLTISDGYNSGTISVPIIDDTLVEDDEKFVVTIAPYSGNVTVADSSAEITIEVTDRYQINISPDFSVDVDDGTATVEVILSSPARELGHAVTINYTTTSGTAVAGIDYTSLNGSITFSDSDTVNPKLLIVPIINDGLQTGSKSFTLDLTGIASGLATFVDDSCRITITDHIFTMTAGTDRALPESAGNIIFSVTLDRDPVGSEEVTVDYATVPGTASAVNDYTTTSGTLTIDKTGTAADKIITVPIVNDSDKEISEQFSVVLSNIPTNTLLSDDTAIGSILDNDCIVSSFTDIAVAEGVGDATLTVQLSNVVPDPVTFDVSYNPITATDGGTDYTPSQVLLTIAPGSTSGTILIPINDDDLVEFAETFEVSIAPISGNVPATDSTAIVAIDVEEKYFFSINNVVELEGNSTMDFTVTLVNPTPLQSEHNGLQLIVNTQDDTAVAPDDYDAIVNGAVTFSDAANTQQVSVTTKSDILDEGAAEQYFVNLTSFGIYAPIIDFAIGDYQGTGTIQDTDYIITPSWNQDGAVFLQSPVGTPISIASGSPVGVDSGQQAQFIVSALYNIQSVTIDGAALPHVTESVTDGQNHTYTFEITTPQGAHTIDVFFDHNIAMTASGSGTVTHNESAVDVHDSGPTNILADDAGTESFLITADAANCVTDVIIDSTSVGSFFSANNNWDGDSYTFNNVVVSHTIEATFGDAILTINLGADDGQVGTSDDLFIQDNGQSGSGWRAYSTDSSYTIVGTPFKAGVHGETISIPGNISCDTQYIVIEFLDVDGWLRPANIQINLHDNFTDQQLEGLYSANSHVLTVISTNGTVSRDPEGEAAVGVERYIYPTGTSVDLIAVAYPTWFFQLWQGDASGTSDNHTITMDSDKTVTAVFVQGCQDADNDGFTTADLASSGCTESPDIDCNDADAEIYPGAIEICGDNVDQDCSGADLTCSGADVDADNDGYTGTQGDCNDSDPDVHPGLYDDPDTTTNEDCYDGPKEKGTEILCSQPSDVPANAATKPAPPMIVFLLDDSGSMDWEFMTTENSQLFSGRYYMHSYNYRTRAYGDTSLSDTQKRSWPSQFTGYNQIYFDSKVVYSPWAKWQDVAAASTYSGSEHGAVTIDEKSYDTNNAAFPDVAFIDGFVHADMDTPRLNTTDSGRGHSWSDVSNDGVSLRFDLNQEFLRVRSAGEGQQVIVTRDGSSTPDSTLADAIGLSTNPDLELDEGHRWDWYDNTAGKVRPEIIFDDNLATWYTEYYSENGTWNDSGSDDWYEWWQDRGARYTQNSGASASVRLNLTAANADTYYVYTWVDEYNNRDGNALYTIFYYDTDSNLQSDNVRIDQSPLNTGAGSDTTYGAHWVRLGNSTYPFLEQSGTNEIVIPIAHYYTWDDVNDDDVLNWTDTDNDGIFDYASEVATEAVYLVTIPGSGRTSGDYTLHYYRFLDANANNRIEDGELLEVVGVDIPAGITPQMYDEKGDEIVDSAQLAYTVRQNFADWFSFYRRRMLTAKAAVGLTVYDMERVELGVHTINHTYHEPLSYMADGNTAEMVTYLQTIYDINPSGSTPLRRGLYEVGKYFEKTDSGDYANLKTSEGLAAGVCGPDDSVYYDADKDVDTDTCDDSGGECQKAYVIAMTDGYYNGGMNLPGDNDNVDNTSTYVALRDGASNALADVAMHFYNTDLDDGLGDKLKVKDYDDATYQHMVTYAVSFGVFGRFNPELFPDCLPAGEPGKDGNPLLVDIGVEGWSWSGSGVQYDNGSGPFAGTCPDWHNAVSTNSANSVDDLFHASVNGRGKFLNAANPAELVIAMQTIKQLIEDQQGTAASVAVNARKIQEDTLLFQTTYDSADWSGNLLAKCVDNTGALAACDRVSCEASCNSSIDSCLNLCTVGDASCEAVCVTARTTCLEDNSCASNLTCVEGQTACIEGCSNNAACEATCTQTKDNCLATDPPERKWSASKQLAARNEVSSDFVQTLGPIPRSIITAQADGSTGVPFTWVGIGATMQALLGGEVDLLEYLRGAHEYEARNDVANVHDYRNRSSRLGDFINSEPYSYSNTSLGIDWVFAGANDGMLHVFDAQTGEEVFAYIPNAVFADLPALAATGYNDGHKFYVDGYVTVKDLGGNVILIGGLGKGGKGYYALNLTAAAQNVGNIEAAADDIVLWEFTTTTQSATAAIADNLGYSFSRPQLIDPSTNAAASYLVFGNGYTSTNQRAVLFLVALDSNGSILPALSKTIDTGEGDGTSCNGLSTPAVIYPQGDGLDDFIYAGDLLGNMWKFDVSDDDPTNWEIYFNDGTDPKPLFTAMSNAGYRQPITIQPDVTISCDNDRTGYLVAFGTGRLLDPVFDAPDTSVQSVYGIWDWSKAWEEEGYASPEQTWLGNFQQQNSTNTGTCISSCNGELGNDATSGTCVFECNGNVECLEECDLKYENCSSNCSAVRNMSNVGTTLGDATAGNYVSLLRQTQVYVAGVNYSADGSISEQVYGATDLDKYDEIVRIMSDNRIDWLEPIEATDFLADATKTIKHVGWYFDLPANGERVIRDVAIVNYKLVYTSSTPNDSPCESGGRSQIWAVDVCSGGQTVNSFFDLNNDGVIDEHDSINIGTEAEPNWVAPSSIQVDGLIPSPTVVEVENQLDRFYFPEDDEIDDSLIQGFGMPIQNWHEIDWQ